MKVKIYNFHIFAAAHLVHIHLLGAAHAFRIHSSERLARIWRVRTTHVHILQIYLCVYSNYLYRSQHKTLNIVPLCAVFISPSIHPFVRYVPTAARTMTSNGKARCRADNEKLLAYDVIVFVWSDGVGVCECVRGVRWARSCLVKNDESLLASRQFNVVFQFRFD